MKTQATRNLVFALALVSIPWYSNSMATKVSAHYITLKTTHPDTFAKEEISVLRTQMPASFLKDRTTDTFICPAIFDSISIGHALNIIKSLSYCQAMNFSEEEIKAWIKTSLIPELHEKLDRDGVNRVLEALCFLELNDEHFMLIANQLSASYEMLFSKSVAQSLAIENMLTLFDAEGHEKELTQTIARRPVKQPKIPIKVAIRDYLEGQLHPSLHYKRKIALSFLQIAMPNALTRSVLDKQSWQSLEMFCGSKSSPKEYVAAKIDRTFTEMGRVFLYIKLATCEESFAACSAQQKVVSYLDKNEACVTELEDAFGRLKAAENIVFGFWDPQNYFERLFYDMIHSFKIFDKLPGAKSLSNEINRSPILLEIGERYEQFQHTIGTASTVVFAGLASAVSMGAVPLAGYLTTAVTAASRGASIGLSGANSLSILSNLANKGEDLDMFIFSRLVFRLKLMFLAEYLEALRDLAKTLKRIVADKDAPKEFADLLKKLDFEDRCNPMQILLKKLQGSTFNGEKKLTDSSLKGAWLVFSRSMGTMLTCYQIVHQHKHVLVPIIAAAGQLDAQLSIARLLKESKGKKAGYCIPTFVEHAQPSVSIVDGWNVMVDPEKVVPNSLTLGRDEKTRAAIITGPNAGGKSTIMKSIILSVVMAQSLGIAPAKSLTLTPFSLIRAYLNIIDDTAGGSSLFMASVNRAQELLKAAETCNARKTHSLTVFDEIFNGTSAKEGEAAACALMQRLADCPSNILLVTTHFRKLTTLKNINNYKVTVGKDTQGKLKYGFRLEEGVTDQNIAFDVLKERGFDSAIIKEAQSYLKDEK